MLVHCLLVESVYLHRLGGSACGNDVLSDRFDRFQAAPGEKHLGPLASKGECNSAAYGASSSVDHRNLVVQHHLCLRSSTGVVNDADTGPSRKWALTPPSTPLGRCLYRMEVRQSAGRRRGDGEDGGSRPDLKGAGRGRRRVP